MMLLVKAYDNFLLNKESVVELVRWNIQFFKRVWRTKKFESPSGIEALTFRTPVEHSIKPPAELLGDSVLALSNLGSVLTCVVHTSRLCHRRNIVISPEEYALRHFD